jgi:hypothetical protein
MSPVKYWQAIADKLSAAGWSWGYCSAVTTARALLKRKFPLSRLYRQYRFGSTKGAQYQLLTLTGEKNVCD